MVISFPFPEQSNQDRGVTGKNKGKNNSKHHHGQMICFCREGPSNRGVYNSDNPNDHQHSLQTLVLHDPTMTKGEDNGDETVDTNGWLFIVCLKQDRDFGKYFPRKAIR